MTITRTHLAGLELALNRLALSGSDYLDLKDLITQAQAAPEAEPVAFVHPSYLGPGMETWAFEASRARLSQLQVPLFTAPQHDAELIELLRADNEALARNLKGKHALTGATYEHLISERDRLKEALEKIAAIEDEQFGGDWDEIEEAREIAAAALSAKP